MKFLIPVMSSTKFWELKLEFLFHIDEMKEVQTRAVKALSRSC